jgi:hypothetical protein
MYPCVRAAAAACMQRAPPRLLRPARLNPMPFAGSPSGQQTAQAPARAGQPLGRDSRSDCPQRTTLRAPRVCRRRPRPCRPRGAAGEHLPCRQPAPRGGRAQPQCHTPQRPAAHRRNARPALAAAAPGAALRAHRARSTAHAGWGQSEESATALCTAWLPPCTRPEAGWRRRAPACGALRPGRLRRGYVPRLLPPFGLFVCRNTTPPPPPPPSLREPLPHFKTAPPAFRTTPPTRFKPRAAALAARPAPARRSTEEP